METKSYTAIDIAPGVRRILVKLFYYALSRNIAVDSRGVRLLLEEDGILFADAMGFLLIGAFGLPQAEAIAWDIKAHAKLSFTHSRDYPLYYSILAGQLTGDPNDADILCYLDCAHIQGTSAHDLMHILDSETSLFVSHRDEPINRELADIEHRDIQDPNDVIR